MKPNDTREADPPLAFSSKTPPLALSLCDHRGDTGGADLTRRVPLARSLVETERRATTAATPRTSLVACASSAFFARTSRACCASSSLASFCRLAAARVAALASATRRRRSAASASSSSCASGASGLAGGARPSSSSASLSLAWSHSVASLFPSSAMICSFVVIAECSDDDSRSVRSCSRSCRAPSPERYEPYSARRRRGDTTMTTTTTTATADAGATIDNRQTDGTRQHRRSVVAAVGNRRTSTARTPRDGRDGRERPRSRATDERAAGVRTPKDSLRAPLERPISRNRALLLRRERASDRPRRCRCRARAAPSRGP